MKLQELKNIIKNEIRLALAENAPAKEKEKVTTPTKPGKPGLIPDKDKAPKTRPKAEANEAVSKGIEDIVKKYKSLKKK